MLTGRVGLAKGGYGIMYGILKRQALKWVGEIDSGEGQIFLNISQWPRMTRNNLCIIVWTMRSPVRIAKQGHVCVCACIL